MFTDDFCKSELMAAINAVIETGDPEEEICCAYHVRTSYWQVLPLPQFIEAIAAPMIAKLAIGYHFTGYRLHRLEPESAGYLLSIEAIVADNHCNLNAGEKIAFSTRFNESALESHKWQDIRMLPLYMLKPYLGQAWFDAEILNMTL